MAVYKRSYSAYAGTTTSPWTRILVLSRYALAEAWSSKITIGIFIFCMLPVVSSMLGIYLANNPLARALIGLRGDQNFTIGANFFLKILQGQCWLALILASWVAPRLISRVGYLLGKFIALFTCLSAVTWVPCLLLFAYQGYTSPTPWIAANLRIAEGLLAGTVIWITVLSILGLALSSWVKWRVVATGVIFAAVFVPAGVGAIVSAVLRTKWGFILNLPLTMETLWRRLLGVQYDVDPRYSLPTAAIVASLVFICIVCFGMLNKRIRAREVVRG